MQISKKTLLKWKKLRDLGDNQKLAEILGMSEEAVSRILRGKTETTSDVLLQIKDFHKKKKALQEKIEE